jgi:UDP-N-acetylglucosamine 2-epimerase (non-hydrolysing)
MRLLFVTHYFHPEGNAPATRVYEMTRRWAERGHRVTVITGVPNVPDGVVYEGYANRWRQRECVAGVEVIRVWSYLAANRGTARRILNYLSFMISAILAGLFVRRPDVVIATSPQFFCGWAGVLLSRLRRRPFVLEVRDLWPESIRAVGALRQPRLIRMLEWLELRMYAAADKVVTVGEGYRQKLEARGVPSQRIAIFPNGVDRGVFQARGADAGVREEYGLGNRFVCAYVGTIGMGSGLEVVLRAALQLRREGRDDVRFLLVGDGAVREELQSRARAERIESVVFTGRQSKSRIPDLLALRGRRHGEADHSRRGGLRGGARERQRGGNLHRAGERGPAAGGRDEAGAGSLAGPEARRLRARADRREVRLRRAGPRLPGFARAGGGRGEAPLRIINVVGARPNLIKIAPLMHAYGQAGGIEPLLVHTGQHYDANMSDLFFRQLGIPEPHLNLEVGSASHAVQTAEIMKAFEPVVLERRPDAVLVVGDVNSTIACGLVAVKLGVKLVHVEAGLRSFDRDMPEEINRVLTDAISDVLLCTESSGVQNLHSEGIPAERIHLVGNVMIDTLLRHRERAEGSTILADLGLEERGYAVLTLHRPSNVDDPDVLSRLLDALEVVQRDMPLVFPAHPRTQEKLARFGLAERIAGLANLRMLDPVGYLDFLKLMAAARVVLTDSGGIQEETTILQVPCLTIRENTERPVTVEMGTNQIVGRDPDRIVAAYRRVADGGMASGRVPPLWDGRAAQRVVEVLVEAL